MRSPYFSTAQLPTAAVEAGAAAVEVAGVVAEAEAAAEEVGAVAVVVFRVRQAVVVVAAAAIRARQVAEVPAGRPAVVEGASRDHRGAEVPVGRPVAEGQRPAVPRAEALLRVHPEEEEPPRVRRSCPRAAAVAAGDEFRRALRSARQGEIVLRPAVAQAHRSFRREIVPVEARAREELPIAPVVALVPAPAPDPVLATDLRNSRAAAGPAALAAASLIARVRVRVQGIALGGVPVLAMLEISSASVAPESPRAVPWPTGPRNYPVGRVELEIVPEPEIVP